MKMGEGKEEQKKIKEIREERSSKTYACKSCKKYLTIKSLRASLSQQSEKFSNKSHCFNLSSEGKGG